MEHGGSRRFLEPIIRHFGTTPLDQIGQDALDRAARKFFPNASDATRNRQLYTPASAVLHHAARRGWCPRPVIERPKPGNARARYLTPVEADRLIEASALHLRPRVVFLLYTGARVGEALWLDWRDVDLARRQVILTTRKTANGTPESRGVPLHPRVVAELANLNCRTGMVFRRPDGCSYTKPKRADDTSAGTRIATAFKAACRRAAISNFRPHDCRHTFASWHYAANRDLGALQRLGGWKTVSMVMRYTHVNVEELTPSIERLPGGRFGGNT